jgi:hypothetical protein
MRSQRPTTARRIFWIMSDTAAFLVILAGTLLIL